MLIYIGLTTILILFNQTKLESTWEHLLIRLIIVLLFIGFTQLKNEKYYFVRVFTPLLLLGFLYSETDYLNNLIFTENLDPIFVNFEQYIFSVQWAEKFSQVWPSNLFAEFMYFGYFSYYLLIIGVPLIIYFKLGAKAAEKTIFIVMNSFLIYYLIFILFPVAGPQFHFENSAQNLPQGYVFGWFIRTIQYYGEAPTAAFPSSHVSICIMLVWICFKNLKKILLVVIPIAILLIFSTVYIKAHYVIDVLAAFIVTPIIYAVSKQLFAYITLTQAQHDYLDT
jgi:membrane-associated phospholipid phosphatase